MVSDRGIRFGLKGLAFSACLSVAVCSLMQSNARADLIAFFGEERVGTSGGQFLRVPAGARALAMGGGMTASINGAGAVFWNPSAMQLRRGGQRVFVSHMEYPSEINVDHVAYARRLGSWQLGLSAGILMSGDIERTTEFHPNGTGQTFHANQFVAGVSLGRDLTDRFSLAATGKFLQETLDDYENRAFFVDLGALYYVGFNRARLGFAVRNFGGDLKLNGNPPEDAEIPGGSWQSFPAPTIAVFGFAYDFGDPRGRIWTVSLDFSHPSDDSESIVFANELGLGKGLYLRGAYRNQVVEGGLSAGFGLHFFRDSFPIRFDYGFDDRGGFGLLHMISLEVGR